MTQTKSKDTFCNYLKEKSKSNSQVENKGNNRKLNNLASVNVSSRNKKSMNVDNPDTYSQHQYAPKKLDAMGEMKCSPSVKVKVGLQNDHTVNVSEKQNADSLRGFETELAEIEKEIKRINLLKDIHYSDYILFHELNGRKSQLLKDKEIHKKMMNEFVKEEIKFLTYIYSVIGDDTVDYMWLINNEIEFVKEKNKLYEEMK